MTFLDQFNVCMQITFGFLAMFWNFMVSNFWLSFPIVFFCLSLIVVLFSAIKGKQ